MSKRGFASMAPEMQKALASKGGKSAHEQGTAHEFTVEEARQAGAKGGKAIAKDRAYMAQIGRRGGLARGRKGKAEKARDSD